MLESLLCNSCGAPLEVPDSANYVQCQHCKTNLKVNRSSDAITTEAIEELREATGNLTQQVQQLAKQHELASLDRTWGSHRQSLMYRNKSGEMFVPSKSHAVMRGIATTFFGVVWLVFAVGLTQAMPGSGPFAIAKVVFPLFGIGFIVVGLLSSGVMLHKSSEYQRAEKKYHATRSAIIRGDD